MLPKGGGVLNGESVLREQRKGTANGPRHGYSSWEAKRQPFGRRRLGRATEVPPRTHAVLLPGGANHKADSLKSRSIRDTPSPRKLTTCVLSPEVHTYKRLLRSSPHHLSLRTFQRDTKKDRRERRGGEAMIPNSQVDRNAERRNHGESVGLALRED